MGAASLFLVSYRFQASLIHVNEAQRVRNLYQVFLNDIEIKKNMALSLATLVAQNPEVAEALAREDRDRLIRLLHPAYQTLERDFGVRQFHFHLPPATSFLRFHALHQFGERMESYRHTINQARETGVGVGGIERGVLGLSLRSVAPVFYRGRQVGTVEFGLSLEKPLLDEFKKNYAAEIVLYLPNGNDPQVFAATVDQPLLAKELFSRLLASGETVFQPETLRERKVAAIVGPLRDFSGKIIGVVKISVDRGPTLALLNRYALLALGLGLLGLAVSIFFVWFISVIFTRRIDEVVRGAEEIAAGRRDFRLPVKSEDELGVMKRSLNQMLASLEESQDRLRDYAQNLEVMVDQRTRSLKESEKTYRTLVENVPLIVYMVMPDGQALFLNRSVEQMIGVSPQHLSGPHGHWVGHLHPDDQTQVVALRAEALRERKELHTEYRMVHLDGHLVYCIDHAVPVFNEERDFIRMDGIVIDVTVQKELQEKNLQTQELETLGQISTRLAHELRNPLMSIGGMARRLSKSLEASDPQAEKGRLILEQVQKLEKILNTMLAFIEPQAIRLQPCNLNQVVTRAVEGLQTKFQGNGIAVKTKLDQNLGLIPLDEALFVTALKHLLENAWHRMGQKGELELSTHKNGGVVQVILTYQVTYISADDIEHYFYPFTVDYSSVKDSWADADLLDVSIPKVVIHKHGGVIHVSKEDDQRIKLTISLPRV
ncbi:MAG: PAS domain-containing protein [Deltaproteobacteria bacterium]|nr:PAS domain-containing protein [Deltaproteobacteria bacterium]